MSTVYPGALDSFTNPTPNDYEDVLSHAGQHSNANDAIEAIEGVLGTTAGTELFSSFSANQKPVPQDGGTIGSYTYTGGVFNSPLVNNPSISVGSDAVGDMYYRDSGGSLTRLPVGSSGQFLTANGTTPSWGTVPTQNNFLGISQVGTTFSGTAVSTDLDVSGLSVQVVVPNSTDYIRVRCFISKANCSASGVKSMFVRIKESSTVLANASRNYGTVFSGYNFPWAVDYIGTTTAGTHTYKVAVSQDAAGTINVLPAPTTGDVAYIYVERL